MASRRALFLLLAYFSMTGKVMAFAIGWEPDGVLLGSTPSLLDRPVRIVPDSLGGALVAWSGLRCDGPCVFSAGAFVQRVLADGSLGAGWDPRGFEAASALQTGLTDLAVAPAGGAWLAWSATTPMGAGYGTESATRVTGVGDTSGTLALNLPPAHRTEARLVGDGAGGAIATWADDADGTGYTVAVQRITAAGTPAWVAGGIPLSARSFSVPAPVISGDASGGAIVGWSDGGYIRAQRVDVDGTRLWPANGVVVADVLADELAIVPDGAHGAILAWHDLRSDDGDIYAMRLNPSGQTMWPAAGVPVCATMGTQSRPAMVPDGAGGVLLTWNDSSRLVFAQRLTALGLTATGWPAGGAVACSEANGLGDPAIAPDGAGGAYVAWTDSRNGKADTDLYAQHLGAACAIAPGWAAAGNAVCGALHRQANPVMVAAGSGGAIVAWQDSRAMETVVDPQIFAQLLVTDGIVPAEIAAVSAETPPGRVRITWYGAAATDPEPVVQRRAASVWSELGVANADGRGFYRYEDVTVTPGATYAYRLSLLEDGVRRHAGEVTVEVPATLTIGRVHPNPSHGAFAIQMRLASGVPARLEVIDLAGRRIESRELAPSESREAELRVGADVPLAPGVYLVRVRQGSAVAILRAVVVR